MAVLDSYDASRLQFVVDALRTMNSPTTIDLTTNSGRQTVHTVNDILRTNGHKAIRNPDGTGMTIAQIATASGLTVAQVTDIAGRI
jgi:hypothetical protein